MTLLLEEARSRVDGLLAKRHSLRTVEDKTQHALDLVQMHFECENPERIDEAIRLYTDDAHWEAPTRRISYQGPQKIKQMYLRLFASFEEFSWEPVERWGNPDRVFDDSIFRGRIISDGIEGCPLPVGSLVHIRLVHKFEITDGLISNETGYEAWLKGDDLNEVARAGHTFAYTG